MRQEPTEWEATPESRIVLVDDDALFLESLQGSLQDRGFAVRAFADAPSLLGSLEVAAKADVLVLDWLMPEVSGIELLSQVRKRGVDVPATFLTGRTQVENEQSAFEEGAIDFIDKTRGVDVLARRLTRVIERSGRPARLARPATHCGPLTLRLDSNRAEWRGRDIGLTLTEYNIVSLLTSTAGDAVTYRAIYDRMHYAGFVAGIGDNGYMTNVRSQVKRLRKKFLAIDAAFGEIVNHAGTGYSWRGPVTESRLDPTGEGKPAEAA